MICTSHGTRNCTQPMCKQRRLREQARAAAAKEAVPGSVGKESGGKASGMWEVRPFGTLPSTFRGAEPGEIWVNSVAAGGEHFGHLPGTPCLHDGNNPDDSGLWEKWGRINRPGARQELTDKTPVTTTDGTGLVAVRWCRHCKDLGI
jgi:hypothetical protein